MRDWLFSRQRYWGEPFPLLHAEDGEVIPLSTDELPVELPPVDEYKPREDGQPPLARAADWLTVTLPDGRKATRETNTMPQWAGSCWYYLRYIDPTNTEAPWDKALEEFWMPVDLYVGGIEHAVLHLLYARFWHKVLYDCDLVTTKEPFQKLFNQGMILAYSYRDANGKYYNPEDVDLSGSEPQAKATGEALTSKIEKMSKSKLNVVNPDDVIDKYGADAMRLYELFMGPLEQVKPWQMAGVEGVYRFLARTWRLVVDENTGGLTSKVTDSAADSQADLLKTLHRTIKKVVEDTEGMRFNTAISQMMTFVNDATSAKSLPRPILEDFLHVLAPYAPHLAEELWKRLGHETMISNRAMPAWDEALCVDATITLIVQVNGKKRGELEAAKDASKDELEKLAVESGIADKFLDGRPAKRIIVVPGRLVNIVG